jgi:catechol 2,3-dioxygenase-like lactoylglutathione lyase family enzyme
MTGDDKVRLTSLLQISMRASDIDRAVEFYRDGLGATFLFRAGDLAFFDLDGVRLMLSRPENPEFDHAGSVLYFRVTDIQVAYTQLRERGVAFRTEPHLVHRDDRHELWMADLNDTEGNVLAIASEVPRDA